MTFYLETPIYVLHVVEVILYENIRLKVINLRLGIHNCQIIFLWQKEKAIKYRIVLYLSFIVLSN